VLVRLGRTRKQKRVALARVTKVRVRFRVDPNPLQAEGTERRVVPRARRTDRRTSDNTAGEESQRGGMNIPQGRESQRGGMNIPQGRRVSETG